MSKQHRKFVKSLKWALQQTPYIQGPGDMPGVMDFLRKDTQIHIQVLKLLTFYFCKKKVFRSVPDDSPAGFRLIEETEKLDVLVKVGQLPSGTFVVEVAGLESSPAFSFIADPILPKLAQQVGIPFVFKTEIRDVVAEGLHLPSEDLQEILNASGSPSEEAVGLAQTG